MRSACGRSDGVWQVLPGAPASFSLYARNSLFSIKIKLSRGTQARQVQYRYKTAQILAEVAFKKFNNVVIRKEDITREKTDMRLFDA